MIKSTLGAGATQYTQAANATQPQVVQGQANLPAQPHTSASSQPPLTTPFNGKLSALQEQLIEYVAASNTDRVKLEHPPAELVDKDTTILDMTKWSSKTFNEGLAQLGHLSVLGLTLDDKRLKNNSDTPRPVMLSLQMQPDRDMNAESVARKAVETILDNTQDKYGGKPGSRTDAEIERARSKLQAPGNRLDAHLLGEMMTSIREAVLVENPVKDKDKESRAPRHALRTPMECMTHLGYELSAHTSQQNTDQTNLLDTLRKETMERVMRHDLGFDDTRSWLDNVKTRCENAGLLKLGDIAKDLHASIPEQANVTGYHTRLHDNIYGRALESKLIGELVSNPPQAVKTAMHQMAKNLSEEINRLPPYYQEQTAQNVQSMLNSDPRSWSTPLLQNFSAAANGQEALAALQHLLNEPMGDGLDCIAIPFLTVKVSLKAVFQDQNNQWQPLMPWMQSANKNYGDVVHPATARIVPGLEHPMMPPPPPNPNRQAAKAGITTHHQPSIEIAGNPAMHPADVNRPNLAEPSVALKQALENGLPYVSGVSGSTNIAMHMVDDMQRKQTSIDTKDALLGIMMFLTYDGGHSMHEALWVAHQLGCETNRLPMTVPPRRDPAAFEAKRLEFLDKLQSPAGADVSANISEEKKQRAKYLAGGLATVPLNAANGWLSALAKELAENNFVADRAGFEKLLSDNVPQGHSASDVPQKVEKLIEEVAVELTKKKERDDFIADYKGFLESFPQVAGETPLPTVAQTAWDETLSYFAKHSHFSPENPPKNP
ncbi:hypothetical protein [Massilia sp. NR 4-1]|uniref:hypothetical protein n=1 Tax=Massilia sp. NR 4-1 TaxID=1678028 RepID=UPI00067BDD65|nr:hypothetical protein [Massilia sp. NR 4-1]AKU20983.1 hypothetical protein ACZ75_05210 [Massilia sp. NR 4-1]